ncbi:unnamed protein product [Malus baccata var. baccata]
MMKWRNEEVRPGRRAGGGVRRWGEGGGGEGLGDGGVDESEGECEGKEGEEEKEPQAVASVICGLLGGGGG